MSLVDSGNVSVGWLIQKLGALAAEWACLPETVRMGGTGGSEDAACADRALMAPVARG